MPPPPPPPIQHGFLLTRSSRDQLESTEIQLWLTTDNGAALLRVRAQQPVCFIEAAAGARATECLTAAGLRAQIKPLALQTFQQQRVCGVYTDTLHAQRRVQEVLRPLMPLYEADLRLHERFLMERFIYGGVAFCGQPQPRDGYVEWHNPRLKPSDYQPTFKVLSLDIECDLDGSLFCVGLVGCGCEQVLMLGTAPSSAPSSTAATDCTDAPSIRWFADERALLVGVVERITALDADILLGWNLINFDLRILLERARLLRLKFAIGRDGQPPTWRTRRGETEQGFIDINGRVAIDGIDALKTATYRFPSFALDSVAQTLLGRGKQVETDVDARFAEIKHNFLHNKPKLAAYNLQDCRLVAQIFAHTQLLDFLRLRSQLTGLELDRRGGSVAAFTNVYLPKLHRHGYIAPNRPRTEAPPSPGGYVFDSKPGLYRNVLVFDFKSLYPAIIRTFKVDPMGLCEALHQPCNPIDGFRGGCFDRHKHLLPQIIADLWQQRDLAKHNCDAPRAQALKILMNSFYGVLGSSGCCFYDARLASSITLRGHQIMQTTRTWIEASGYPVIYGDTDSLFVWVEGEPSNQACRAVGLRLQQDINQRWQQKLQQEFDLECFLELEFETHFSRFLMPTVRGTDTGSKKRYAGLVQTPCADGVQEELIFKGLENVRTDWTPLARTFQAELYALIFHAQDPCEFIRQTVRDTLSGKLDRQLIYRKQFRRRLDQYVKNIPPQVRAARLADAENHRRGKPLRYQHKGWINYVLSVNGAEPVEYQTSTIDYQHYVERQLKPVADAILPFVELDFDSIISTQVEMF